MKTSSAKAKGRRLQDAIVAMLLEHFKEELEEGDLRPAIMGESGIDVKRSPLAKKIFPLAIEAKCQEKLNVWSSLKQAEDNAESGDIPALIFKRNFSKMYITLEFDKFLDLLKQSKIGDK